MSQHELIDRLVTSFDEEASGLERLVAAMRGSRTAWLALRPSDLEEAVERLRRLADHAMEMGSRRSAALCAVGSSLGLEPRSILRRPDPRIPRPAADRICRAAGRAVSAAEALRRENGMGNRLLEFSRLSQEGMFHSIAGTRESHTRGYDRHARAIVQPAARGSFVDGRL